MSVPLIPTFLPISVIDDSDTSLMPIMNTFRGDIVPAYFDPDPLSPTYNTIVNHPTPFYILCTAKIYNTGNDINTLPTRNPVNIDVRTYQQFGITQGDPTTFPGTDATRTNSAATNQFTLTTFNQALTTQVQNGDSPGLLVPVYCYQDTNANGSSTSINPTQPSFGFFRADVFWNGDPSSDYNKYVEFLPDQPKDYKDFPTPYGVSIDNIYNLASVYNTWTKNNNRIATWSLFATNNQIILINSANPGWNVGPQAAKVTISFNNPSAAVKYKPVNILRTSTLYTVSNMNQYNSSEVYMSAGGNQTIQGYVGNKDARGGYPLNFIYQVGTTNGYKKSQGLYQNYFQNDTGNYQGTICQSSIPFQQNEICVNSPWDIQNIATFFEGSKSGAFYRSYDLVTNYYTSSGSIESTSYSCNCSGAVQYNAACTSTDGTNNQIVSTNGGLNDVSFYYYNNCNLIHAGLYQFVAFQFIPINFFNSPPKGSIPSIISPSNGATGGTGYTGPKLSEFYSEEGFPGSIGPTGTTGPSWPTQGTGAILPGPPVGPTGAGIYTITYPYNGATGSSNPWPDNSAPNRMNNVFLTQTISGWIGTPDDYVCPTLISDEKYCGFQDYYHSLMGYFYTERPQDLQPNSSCGKAYIPPFRNMFLEGFYPNGGCTGTTVCVPNYDWLENPITAPGPFICQESTQANPYPESKNGFNNTNTYKFYNYNGISGNTIDQDPDGTPITWENLYTYINLTPTNNIQSNQVSFAIHPYTDTQKLATTQNVNPQTGKTQNQKGPGTVVLFLIILVVVIVIGIIIFIFVKSGNSKKKDMYNPGNELFYSQVV
jgi:hypothetical protein